MCTPNFGEYLTAQSFGGNAGFLGLTGRRALKKMPRHWWMARHEKLLVYSVKVCCVL
ncbi:hypothetical protein PJE062_2060 [Pseudovibrio sp. JE062]|nr:hypothetical protein PJE062_2060 [Pseudovibrio sp. JE062]